MAEIFLEVAPQAFVGSSRSDRSFFGGKAVRQGLSIFLNPQQQALQGRLLEKAGFPSFEEWMKTL